EPIQPGQHPAGLGLRADAGGRRRRRGRARPPGDRRYPAEGGAGGPAGAKSARPAAVDPRAARPDPGPAGQGRQDLAGNEPRQDPRVERAEAEAEPRAGRGR
ncbi:MAG: hypothetical protein AVDCRST_MAG64-347, partial [uncultured Phycisphaerae bacterium]